MKHQHAKFHLINHYNNCHFLCICKVISLEYKFSITGDIYLR